MCSQSYLLIFTIAVSLINNTYFVGDGAALPNEPKPVLIGRANPALQGLDSVVFNLKLKGDGPGTALQASLRKEIANRLSGAGIGWLMPKPGTAGPVDAPAFTVTVDMLKPADSKQYVIRVQTSLSANVCLKSNSSMCLKAELWKITSPMQAVSTKDISKAITTEAVSHTEAFIVEHSVANQAVALEKEPTVPEKREAAAEYKYVASKKSRVFHRPDCSSVKRISPNNLVGFAARDDAVKTKRRPCKRCKP